MNADLRLQNCSDDVQDTYIAMPPKKGKKKQVDDDWEAELGETIAPPAEELAKEGKATTTQIEPEGDDEGGLMSQLGKKKVCHSFRIGS